MLVKILCYVVGADEANFRQRDWGTRGLELDAIVVCLNSMAYKPNLITTISLFTAGTLIGFDASGHIAEETKNAR